MQEIEATLIICSETPQNVALSIAALARVAEYTLQPRPPASIRDYYLDTAQRVLRRASFSLRLREIDQTLWLTIKGPPKRLAEGIVEQLELEIPWARESLARIRQELASRGVQLPVISLASAGASPLETLIGSGMEMVQQRHNHRQIRNVLDGAKPYRQSLAELSIDSVVYHFGRSLIRHYEVEIEAKSEEGVAVLSTLTQGLADLYPSILRRWGHGKLATGRAAAVLLEEGKLNGLLGNDRELMPPTYAEIHHYLQEEKA